MQSVCIFCHVGVCVIQAETADLGVKIESIWVRLVNLSIEGLLASGYRFGS